MKMRNSDFMMITGDINDRCSSWFDNHTSSELELNLFNLANVYNLSELIYEPTRYTDNNAYILDLIFVDCDKYVKNYGVKPPLLNRDHCSVFCQLNFKVSKPHAFKRRVWDYKATDFNSLNVALSNAPFDTAYAIFNDIEDIVGYTNDLIISTCSEFIPNKIVTDNKIEG